MLKHLKRYFKYVVVVILVFLIVIFSRSVDRKALLANDNSEFVKAVVTSVNGDYDIDEETGVGDNQNITAVIKSGKYKGKTITCTAMTGYLYGANCEAGTKIILRVSEYNGELSATVYNYDREAAIYLLILAFLITMLLVGGRKGLDSVIALIFTFVVVLFLYIPLMYIGFSPFLAAVVTVIMITVITNILLADISTKSVSAMAGSICGVIFAGIIAFAFGKIAHITGYNVADIETLVYIGANSKLQIGEMLFSGILISSIGAVMDVAMSIASAINEIKLNNTKLPFGTLFKSGMNVGRDMIGTMSNTLILAYVGGNINLIMIIYAYIYPLHQVLNMYDLAIQIMVGVAGTMGIILTVPITSLISTILLSKKKENFT